MLKQYVRSDQVTSRARRRLGQVIAWGTVAAGLGALAALRHCFAGAHPFGRGISPPSTDKNGRFPFESDPFHFIPCTNATLPPPLDDPNPLQTWAAQFDPNPSQWSWSQPKLNGLTNQDKFSDRGI